MLIGIVGKPSTGKSTFFKACTLAEVEISSRPFTTIKPNEGVGFVRVDCVEKFFNVRCNPVHGFCIDGQRFVPVRLMDVAGLVPGASEGKGLGNRFLDDLGSADVLINIVDAAGSTNEIGEEVAMGSYDPCNDIVFLEREIDLWFANLLLKNWKKFARQSSLETKSGDVAIAKQFSGLKVTLDMVRFAMRKMNLTETKLDKWTEDNVRGFATELRKVSKPLIIAANKMDLPSAKANIEKMKKQFPDYLIVPCSAESELALREAAKKDMIKYVPGNSDFNISDESKLSEHQKKALSFIKEKILGVWKNTGVQNCLNAAVFDFLKYIVVFPGGLTKLADVKGNILPDAFLLPPNSTALDFAGTIHSDFAKHFIRAIDVKKKLTIGRDHLLKNGDVVEIISGK